MIASFFTATGPGGLIVIGVIILAAVTYYLLTRWIIQGGENKS